MAPPAGRITAFWSRKPMTAIGSSMTVRRSRVTSAAPDTEIASYGVSPKRSVISDRSRTVMSMELWIRIAPSAPPNSRMVPTPLPFMTTETALLISIHWSPSGNTPRPMHTVPPPAAMTSLTAC